MSTPVSTRPETASGEPGTWPQAAGKRKLPERWKAARPSRRIPYLLLGIILVIACAAAAMVVTTRLDDRQSVLMLARSVSVGQLLSAQDLQHVAVSTDAGLQAVPAAESSSVLGRPVAYSLPAGTLLTRVAIGAAATPAAGQAEAAVGLTAGQFPPSLASGARVAVLVSAASAASSGSTASVPVAQWTATVVDIGASRTEQQTTVVTLLLPDDDARRLAIVPDEQINLVALSGGGR